MSTFTEICALSDIPQRGSRQVVYGENTLALFRSGDDQVFALLDRCPHKGGRLSQGIVHGHQVTCPLHSWKLELESGQAVSPDVGCAKKYPVELRGDRVFVAL
jgi:nitrite reductase (NADH) small subunit